MTSPTHFTGWLAHSPSAASGTMTWTRFTPKPWTPHDLDIKISHCGICGSDIHTLRSGWSATHYPTCVGHEIIGHVARVGTSPSAQRFRLGERVGVGAQAWACRRAECDECARGLPQHCPRMVGTYNGRYKGLEGGEYWSMGGYADYVRVAADFCVSIPDAIPSAEAAPLMCGGITVWSPLRNNGAGPGVRVGVVGLGGLGHFGVLFARALGCERVVAISRRRGKEADARALGADAYIATSEDEGWARTHARSLDLIVCTVSGADMPLGSYLRLLRTGGRFVQVGAPEGDLPPISAFALIAKGVTVGGSQIGSPREIEEMLGFVVEKGVRPWVQTRSMREANRGVVEFEEGKARYRFVLVNEEAAKL